MANQQFIPGLKLSERFFVEVVRPIIDDLYPRLDYSAGLIGWGSEVLGYDTPRSTDHMWGPRVLLFLPEEDHGRLAPELHEQLRQLLPATFNGYSVHFGPPDEAGVRLPAEASANEVHHLVEIFSPESFLLRNLNIESEKNLKMLDWLGFDEQSLLEISSGKVFYDGLRRLNGMRRTFSYYPRDVWLHKLSRTWQQLSDEEAFPGRCDEVDDKLGWKLIVSRQVERIMRLCFLLERRYAPYGKWFGTAFGTLKASKKLSPILAATLEARTWEACEPCLTQAYEFVARKHNRLEITEKCPGRSTLYFGRPFKVIWGDCFADACRKAIRNTQVRNQTIVHRH